MLKKAIALLMIAVFMFGFVGGALNLKGMAVHAADQKAAVLSMETVIKIVKEKYNDVQIKSVEKELKDNKAVYEIKFSDSSDDKVIYIEADTGRILKNAEKSYQKENEDHHNEMNDSEENEIQNDESEEHDGDNREEEDGDNTNYEHEDENETNNNYNDDYENE